MVGVVLGNEPKQALGGALASLNVREVVEQAVERDILLRVVPEINVL